MAVFGSSVFNTIVGICILSCM